MLRNGGASRPPGDDRDEDLEPIGWGWTIFWWFILITIMCVWYQFIRYDCKPLF